MAWHDLALTLFYDEGFKVVEIAEKIGKTKQAVSKFLSNQNPEEYEKEKNRRKKLSKEREKERKRNWKRENFKTAEEDIDYALLRVQHDNDVGLLSTRSNPPAIAMWKSGYIRSAYEQKGSGLRLRERTDSGAVIPSCGLPKRIS